MGVVMVVTTHFSVTKFISKLIFLQSIIFSSYISACAGQTIYLSPFYKNTNHAQAHFKAEKATILWDLHDVLFKKNPSSKSSSLAKIANPATLFNLCINCGKLIFDKNFWKIAMKRISSKEKIENGVWLKLLETYPRSFLEDLVNIATASYIPCNATLTIVQQLCLNGYNNYLFSNIFYYALLDLRNTYPSSFRYFTTAENSINPLGVQEYIFKPRAGAYTQALSFSRLGSHRAHLGIFIDDSLVNIKMAQTMGITGILFLSPEQLIADLNMLLGIRLIGYQ